MSVLSQSAEQERGAAALDKEHPSSPPSWEHAGCGRSCLQGPEDWGELLMGVKCKALCGGCIMLEQLGMVMDGRSRSG